ncbi:hypothetical protein CFAM422_000608 [Trichoderma lentiforme]|uniref:Uncharacterized protein n=1 Tax=Trichoderma lentiforme TaxID=1567552 RepID=A0A9P4XPU2_9HYPO|nr:hypothetical protein CFAM422_000608 [Trichoderma lentiforme]
MEESKRDDHGVVSFYVNTRASHHQSRSGLQNATLRQSVLSENSMTGSSEDQGPAPQGLCRPPLLLGMAYEQLRVGGLEGACCDLAPQPKRLAPMNAQGCRLLVMAGWLMADKMNGSVREAWTRKHVGHACGRVPTSGLRGYPPREPICLVQRVDCAGGKKWKNKARY